MQGFEPDDDLFARQRADIEPQRLYGFRAAASLIPSVHGRGISPRTLRRWYEDGRFEAEIRAGRKRPSYFIRGSELLKLLETTRISKATLPMLPVRSKHEADQGYNAAMDYAAEHIYARKA